MTDNEIIKALEYCKDCSANLNVEIIDLITRQQREIENLKVENQSLRSAANSLKIHYEEAQAEIERLKECPKCVYEYDGEITEYCVQDPCPNFQTVEQIKSEAYKEFAKLLKRQAFDRLYVSVDEINNLLKEMAGEDNAKEKE